jgi:hypothetical protein
VPRGILRCSPRRNESSTDALSLHLRSDRQGNDARVAAVVLVVQTEGHAQESNDSGVIESNQTDVLRIRANPLQTTPHLFLGGCVAKLCDQYRYGSSILISCVSDLHVCSVHLLFLL